MTRETRKVIHDLPALQALPPGTILKVQGDRAAQVEAHDDWDIKTGESVVAKHLSYVGTDLSDDLTSPTKEERDTLRRMLPAVVVDPAS